MFLVADDLSCIHRKTVESDLSPLSISISRRFGIARASGAERVRGRSGSGFLELASDPHEENASYFVTWLEVLRNDSRFIFKAAAHAQRPSSRF
jgi:antirestriction protein ArdC